MEAFNSNITESRLRLSRGASQFDPQTDPQLIRSRSGYSFASPTLDSPTSDPLVRDSTLIRYYRAVAETAMTAAAAVAAGFVPPFVDVLRSPAFYSGEIYRLFLRQRFLQHLINNSSSSRGFSSSPVYPGSSSANSLYNSTGRRFVDRGRPSVAAQTATGASSLASSFPRDDLRLYSRTNDTKVCRHFAKRRSCPYGPACHFIHNVAAVAQTTSTIKVEQGSSSVDYWSPTDDNIEVWWSTTHANNKVLLTPLSTEDSPAREIVNAYINHVIYGPRLRRRLPIFYAIC